MLIFFFQLEELLY